MKFDIKNYTKKIEFGSLFNGEKFVYNGQEYLKRISDGQEFAIGSDGPITISGDEFVLPERCYSRFEDVESWSLFLYNDDVYIAYGGCSCAVNLRTKQDEDFLDEDTPVIKLKNVIISGETGF